MGEFMHKALHRPKRIKVIIIIGTEDEDAVRHPLIEVGRILRRTRTEILEARTPSPTRSLRAIEQKDFHRLELLDRRRWQSLGGLDQFGLKFGDGLLGRRRVFIQQLLLHKDVPPSQHALAVLAWRMIKVECRQLDSLRRDAGFHRGLVGRGQGDGREPQD